MMSRKCPFTGKQTRSGRKYSRRGKAKRLGGVGIKVTSKTKRKFKPNMQRVRALVDGKVMRINVSTSAIRNGSIIKPGKRNWNPDEDSAG
jgi:large subunit ribosomal protein L28